MIIAVIPAYNEEKHLSKIITITKKYVDKVIVVDDGSKDKTSLIGKKADSFMSLAVNMGKGFALRVGCEEAIKQKADFIVMIDADGQHDPSEIPEMINELKTHDLVIGTREFTKMPFGSKIGNIILTTAFYALFLKRISDTQSGFRGFKAKAYRKISWKSNRYGVETEMLVHAAKNNIKMGEISIKTIYHDVYKGTTFLDGIKIMLMMLFWRVFQ